MSFNKRYVSEETIRETIKNEDSLKKLFSSDAIIFVDDFSTKVYELLINKNTPEKDVVKFIEGKKIKKNKK
jgi:hypothetical protein